MNICLIGDGLISLTLAKTLINNKIKVFMYYKNNKKTPSNNRTIGITSNNLDFFQKEIIKIKKDLFWEINQIEIYSEQNKKEKILNFEEPKKILFSIVKNNDLYDLLNRSLEKNNNLKKTCFMLSIERSGLFFIFIVIYHFLFSQSHLLGLENS